jgi:hypothetical protein
MNYSPLKKLSAGLLLLSISLLLPTADSFVGEDTTGFHFFEGDPFGHSTFVCSSFDPDAYFVPSEDANLARAESDYLDSICRSLDTYNNAVRFNRGTNSSKHTWKTKCDEFDPIDDIFCPTQPCVDYFCDSFSNPLHSHLNPTVRKHYCEPFFGLLLDDDRRAECTNHCVNYVSQDRGACCDWTCVA